MRQLLTCLAAAGVFSVGAAAQNAPSPSLDNNVVRAYRTTGSNLTGLPHRAGAIVFLSATTAHQVGDAVWATDVAAAADIADGADVAVVVPKRFAATATPASASKPGDGTFTGMSFKPVFENDRVAAIRARMEVGAAEAFHTHASDTVVVHLSGGEIEDTADGVTKVNHWKHGDIEFESRGSSHSARNIGHAVDVVLVTLEPQRASR